MVAQFLHHVALGLAFGRGFFLSIARQQASAASGWRSVMVSAFLGAASARPLSARLRAFGQAEPDQFPKTYAVASVCVGRRSLLVGGISVRPKAHNHMRSRRVDKLTSCQIVRGKVGQNRLDKLTSCQEVRSFCLEHNILCCSMYACTKRTFCMTVLSRAARYCSYCSYIVPSGSVRKSLIIQ